MPDVGITRAARPTRPAPAAGWERDRAQPVPLRSDAFASRTRRAGSPSTASCRPLARPDDLDYPLIRDVARGSNQRRGSASAAEVELTHSEYGQCHLARGAVG